MILLRPLNASFSARFRTYKANKIAFFRDILIVFLLLIFSSLIFFSSRWLLKELGKDANFVLIPEIPLIFSFNLFIPMIFFTALSGVISLFYTSDDLELILGSPISEIKFFIQRYLLVIFETSWMSIISILPFLLAFPTIYHTSFMYYLLIPIYLILFLFIPSALALLFGILWALIVPRIPAFLLISFGLGTGLYLLHELTQIIGEYFGTANSFNPDIVLAGLGKVSSFGSSWSPATWMAMGLSPFLSATEQSLRIPFLFHKFILSLLASFSLLWLSVSLAFILHIFFYKKALSLVWGRQKKLLLPRFNKKTIAKSSIIPFKYQVPFNIWKKELLDFIRDPSQIIQTFFLLSIIAFYVYLLRFQQNFFPLVQGLQKETWDKLLLIIHLILECFIVVAMMTRLIFPSISREGRTIWILQSSPIKTSQIVLYKYLFYTIPIALILSFLSASSFYLQFNSLSVSLLKVLISISIAAVCGSLAMYLGARTAQFNWESRSQLVASIGSLIFMILGLFLSSFSNFLSMPLFESLRVELKISSIHLIFIVLILLFNTGLSVYLIKKASISLRNRLFSI